MLLYALQLTVVHPHMSGGEAARELHPSGMADKADAVARDKQVTDTNSTFLYCVSNVIILLIDQIGPKISVCLFLHPISIFYVFLELYIAMYWLSLL